MGLGGFLKKALGTVAGVGSVIPGPWQLPAVGVSAGLGALGGAKAGAQGEGYRQQAAGLATKDYERREPMRQKLLEMIFKGGPQRRDLSALFQDQTNPFARARGNIPTTATPVAPPQALPFRPPVGGPGMGGSPPGVFGRPGPFARPGEGMLR